ncbi:site-specific integrase [Polaromonas sp. JS666]|uniref:site-specific integrase n=1 Tax=Polaromonas sp. (strain JS666 / ATCC BAA-500) TaxID=296591 RepID=UPI0000464728|nr:site-specific integrase [Polaromonas sp. JS666]ABE47369.1 phage integrase [Polaromonas sp. JS666]
MTEWTTPLETLLLDGPVTLGHPAPAAKKRGRPVGWRMPTLANLKQLTLEDFSFVRGVMSGMKPAVAFRQFYANRHFDADGNPVIPHGAEINSHAEKLQQAIFAAARSSDKPEARAAALALERPTPEPAAAPAAVAQAHMDYTQWAESQPEDMYSENEMVELYKDYLAEQGVDAGTAAHQGVADQSLSVGAKVKAINALQTQLANLPLPEQETNLWLAPSLVKAFARRKVTTMAGVVQAISVAGRHWHRTIKGLGPGRAARVEGWLDDHADTLGHLQRRGQHWEVAPPLAKAILPLQRPPAAALLSYTPGSDTASVHSATLVLRSGIAPLELMLIPPALDGQDGMFRTQTPNHLGARTDIEAVGAWLNSYLAAGKQRTYDAYRREVERFYIWAVLEAKCALSSITLGLAQQYQAFLQAVPDRYIGTARVTRHDPRWRPWRGQIETSSQNYALGVLYQMYRVLHENAYVTGNPFASIQYDAGGMKRHAMDVTRSLHTDDLYLVREALAALPGLRSGTLRKAALARRTRLILHVALTTGMRLAEIASANLSSLGHPVVDGRPADDWVITVLGKGQKLRDVPISEKLLSMILEHHADWRTLMKGDEARIAAFDLCPPLVAVLEAPVRDGGRAVTDQTQLKNDNSALSANALYRTLKTFFRQMARKERDEKLKARILKFSTHWLRHTFAHEVLRENDGDEGLKLAQQLLGHASINTTAEYVRQDLSAKVKAARKVNPLG